MFLGSYRTFIKIVETGSLAATARELHISPSAVSKQLAGLEQRLGAKLLQRSTRSVRVTEVGERFFHRCIEVLQAAEAAESEVRDLTGELGGELKIALPQAVASEEFTSLLYDFTRTFPNITLDIRVSNAAQKLIENKFDVAFRVGNLKDSRLLGVELFRARVVMCASPEYVQRFGIPTKLSDLTEHTLLAPSYHYLQSEAGRLQRSTARSGDESHILCDDLGVLLNLAKSGAGVAMMWESYVRVAVAQGSLHQFNSLIEHSPRPVSMLYLSRDYVPRRLTLFLEYLRAHYGKAVAPTDYDERK